MSTEVIERTKERRELHICVKETLKVLTAMLEMLQPATWLLEVNQRDIISASQAKVLWRDYIDRRTQLIEKMQPLAELALEDLTAFMEKTKPHES